MELVVLRQRHLAETFTCRSSMSGTGSGSCCMAWRRPIPSRFHRTRS